MKFELFPIIDTMLDLYSRPRTPKRFEKYITMLRESRKGDLVLPIAGFNPMAKEHVSEKLNELKRIKAEQIMEEALASINHDFAGNQAGGTYKVVLNLADDLKGGWTNRFTTDYDSKFKLNAFVSRNFCAPYFWTSESFSAELIRRRTLEYAYRTIYWLRKPKPITLEEHLEQEIFVAEKIKQQGSSYLHDNLHSIKEFYSQHSKSDNYNLIFNFFYGDEVATSLAFPTFGLPDQLTGYEYAKIVAVGKLPN